MMEIEVILPAVSEEPLSDMLRAITEAIVRQNNDKWVAGFFGGSFGYGAEWDSDVFMMHPFCWCERDDCRWCSDDACGCPDLEPEFYVDGVRVTGDEHWAANKSIVAPLPFEVAKHGTKKHAAATAVFDASIKERNSRLKTIFPARQHRCEPLGMMADRPRGESWKPSQCAPNFWHKASGLKVWWYKYIGRDMEALGLPTDLTSIFRESLADIAAQVGTRPKGQDGEAGLGSAE